MAGSSRKGTESYQDDSVSLNKFISDSGFCSRRDADLYIEQGRVSINGREAKKGNRVHAGAVVEVDGEPLRKKVKTIYMAFHKPVGVTSTTDTKDRTNMVSFINHPQRIFPVGRLDKESEGLIFLTNDGNIVNKILRAGNRHEKEYIVTVDKPVSTDFIRQMSEGVQISGELTLPCKVSQEGKSVFRITLVQGLNRQIRRMSETLGYRVVKLVRVRIMNVRLGKLPPGHWRYLTEEEIGAINGMIATSDKTEAAAPKRQKRPVAPAPKRQKEVSSVPAPHKATDPPKKEAAAGRTKKKTSYKDFRGKVSRKK